MLAMEPLLILFACALPFGLYPLLWNRLIRREWERKKRMQGLLLVEKRVIFSNLFSIQFSKAHVKCSPEAIVIKTNSMVWPYIYIKTDVTSQDSQLGRIFAIKRLLEQYEIIGDAVKLYLKREHGPQGRKEALRIKGLSEAEIRLFETHIPKKERPPTQESGEG